MSQYTFLANRASLEANTYRQHAMALLGPNIGEKAHSVMDDAQAIHEALLLSLPEGDWSIEVDVLGRIRVTVKFSTARKGP